MGLEFGEPPDRVVDVDRGPVHPSLYESRIWFFHWPGSIETVSDNGDPKPNGSELSHRAFDGARNLPSA